MNLGLADKTLWVVSPSSDVGRNLAVTALEEGARVAVFGPVTAGIARPLRLRFGLQVLPCAWDPATEDPGPPGATARQWGGAPAGLVFHVPGPEPLAVGHAQLQTFSKHLTVGGAVVVLRDCTSADADEARLMETFEADLDVARTFVHDPARLSMIGCLPTEPPSQGGASPLSDPACAALAVFLIGRGGPQLTLVGRDGFIQAVPGVSA